MRKSGLHDHPSRDGGMRMCTHVHRIPKIIYFCPVVQHVRSGALFATKNAAIVYVVNEQKQCKNDSGIKTGNKLS